MRVLRKNVRKSFTRETFIKLREKEIKVIKAKIKRKEKRRSSNKKEMISLIK